MSPNIVFISYPSEDHLIAEAIGEAISSLKGNKLDVFRDRIHIQGGARIPTTIHEALKQTAYFVAVGTNVLRRNFDWCGQELGFYQGSFEEDNRKETCLYHSSAPDLFAGRLNYPVRSLKREHRRQFGEPILAPKACPIYDFLISIADLNLKLHPSMDQRKYWSDVEDWSEKYADLISETFFKALENRVEQIWFPQARLEISIDRGDFYKSLPEGPPDLPEDAEVRPSSQFYSLFKNAPPEPNEPKSWKELKEFVMENARNDILTRMISDITVGILPSRDDTKNDYIIQTPNQKFYRVLLVRHSIYGNKRREFIFNLIETAQKVTSGDTNTTMLAAGIYLGSKYRSIFHETEAKYALGRFSNLSPEEVATKAESMLKDVDRINADAAADGLANFESLAHLLGDTQEVKSLFKAWWSHFPAMETAAKALLSDPSTTNSAEFLTAYADFLEMSWSNNSKFIQLCIEAYQKLTNIMPESVSH